MNNRVMIGMSGGVDSSVAAYLLKKKGYDVVGVNMRLCSNEDYVDDNSTEQAIEDARKVAEKLEIPFYVLDMQDEFREKVINPFIDAYISGKTPNPCVICNKHIKFGMFFEKAKEFGCDYVATGHYAKIEKDEDTGRYLLKKGDSDKKDQTYNLYNIKQDQLSRILLPIGEYEKEEVRKIAKEIGLEVHNKKDSQEICFIKDDDYIGYLTRHANKKIKQGKFIDSEGNVLGTHKGIINYTIGQRKGLGIAFGKPMFVIDINAKNNSVVLGDNSDLFEKELTATDVNFIPIDFSKMDEPIRVEAKIRYAAKPSPATVYKIGEDKIRVVFDEPQRAITKGQSLVMYDGRTLVGGGIIDYIGEIK